MEIRRNREREAGGCRQSILGLDLGFHKMESPECDKVTKSPNSSDSVSVQVYTIILLFDLDLSFNVINLLCMFIFMKSNSFVVYLYFLGLVNFMVFLLVGFMKLDLGIGNYLLLDWGFSDYCL